MMKVILSVPDEGYSINETGALMLIFTFYCIGNGYLSTCS
jgi:hypothetical protein